MTANLEINESTARAIEKFTELSVEHYEAGSMSKRGWEHARSYAVEALKGLLHENPRHFDYAARIQAVADRSRERATAPTSEVAR